MGKWCVLPLEPVFVPYFQTKPSITLAVLFHSITIISLYHIISPFLLVFTLLTNPPGTIKRSSDQRTGSCCICSEAMPRSEMQLLDTWRRAMPRMAKGGQLLDDFSKGFAWETVTDRVSCKCHLEKQSTFYSVGLAAWRVRMSAEPNRLVPALLSHAGMYWSSGKLKA